MPKERDTIKDMIGESSDTNGRRRDSSSDTVPVDLTPLAKQMLRAEEGGKEPCLLVLDGVDAGKVIPIGPGSIVIGRNSSCDICLNEDGISRQHARLELSGKNRLVVEDLSSTNGTFMAGKRIGKAILKVDDKILFGRRTMLRFVLEDILDRIYEQERFASSTRDNLTGIANRNYIKQRILSDLSLAKRHGTPFTFLKFDIDNFKKINSDHGHQTGDQALVTAAQTVSEMLRTEDVFGRVGDDEFGIVAVGIDYAGGKAMGDRIRSRLAERKVRALDMSGKTVCLTVSVGVATMQAGSDADMDKIITVVNDNLSMAKQKGHNRVVSSQII
ncbi:MAG: GGDEF domain-containing protein [Deltaproteobacteria bacterium]|nr:GGDEF domain-containing protein [Deltaproteobacteria bacterium]